MTSFIEDLGLFCKHCDNFFNFLTNPAIDKKFELQGGEETLVELVVKCPVCGQIDGYAPDEVTLRDPSERKRMGLPDRP